MKPKLLCGRRIANLVRRKLQYTLFRQKWNIGITQYTAPVVAGLEGTRLQRDALRALQWMDETPNGFAADPFIARLPENEYEYVILFEGYPWSQNRGIIESISFQGGKFFNREILLDSKFHLSYPFIFEFEGELSFFPEHSESRDLSLYKIDGSRRIFETKKFGYEGSLIDTTILYHNNLYWMFATQAGEYVNRDLFIYYSRDLRSTWSSHPHNPVKSDVSNARPAGQIINHAGKLFRPAQDCRTHYGSGVIVNEIRTLTEHAFEEVPVSEIRPEPGSRYEYGLHTISSAGDYTVIDGARVESSLHPALDAWGRYLLPRPAAPLVKGSELDVEPA